MSQTKTKPDHLVVFAGNGINAGASPSKRLFERDGQKILEVKNVPVFRSGTFRDSMGFQHEFDGFAMESMVRNYDHLKAQGIFSDVPVRNGHPSPFTSRMQELIGYVTSMRTEDRTAPHDGAEYTYLIADFEIIDEDAQKNINSGLWRNRSSEIGTYVDNRENQYGPAFLGVAYVDIPAVEGLNGFSKAGNTDEAVSFVMEDAMTGVQTPPAPGATPFSFSLGGQTGITDPKVVQDYISSLESEKADFQTQLSTVTGERDKLAEFKQSIIDADRVAFVTGLVDGNQVLASQKDSLTTLAKGLSDEQFEIWKSSFAAVESKEIFGNHGGQTSKKPESGVSPEDADFEEDKKMVKILAGRLPHERLIETDPYKSVIARDPSFKV
ncbi:capsid maturation protease [Gordonia phage Jumbo]|uniref:Capsid maturation protease n=1 Tax=Gordonia phage Jumbo TaxID=1887650 RepID=A0A1B3B0I2_9CAUD|nr:head maturation protease [Gordonia phage Jumbo]AOE44523.1 capsid maturation protease [Gordonia phage Jumbo]